MAGGGGSTTTTNERPGAMDFLNADVIKTLAPYLIQGSVAELGGGMTSDKSQAIQSSISQGLQSGAAPGTSQMFAQVNKGSGAGKGTSQGALNQALMLYGKQPAATPGGGSSTTTPGLTDYTQTLADVMRLLGNFNSPLGADNAR